MGFIISGQATAPGESYFIAQGPSNGTSEGKSIARDSSGNIYTLGAINDSTDISLVKYNSAGTVVWQYKLDSGNNDAGNCLHIDSSDNIFVGGRMLGLRYGQTYTAPYGESYIAKFNTNGAIQWQRKIAAVSYGSEIQAIATNSVGDIIVSGYASTPMGWMAKLNSSGVVQWFKTGDSRAFSCIAIDSSDNMYVSGGWGGVWPPIDGGLVKMDSNGNQLWRKNIGAAGLAVSSSGYVYVSFADARLAKLSASDGSVVWQRLLDNGTDDTQLRASHAIEYVGTLAIDSSENIYWLSNVYFNYNPNDGVQNAKAIIIKHDSSGTQQWQRQMDVSGTSYPNAFDYLNRIIVDNSSSFYVTGRMNNKVVIAKLPTDGTQTGTYTVGGASIIYSTSTITVSTGTASIATDSNALFTASTSYSQAADSYTPTSTSFTTALTVTGTGAGVPMLTGMRMAGTGGMVISSYVPPPNWLNLMTGLNTNSAYNYNVASNGTDMYVIGTYMFMSPSNNPGRGVSIYKYNSAGVLQWSKRQYQNHYYYDAWDAEVDSSGNLYVAGCLFNGHGGYSTISTLKYDSAGNLLWRSALHSPDGNYSQSGGSSGGSGLFGKDLVLDSAGNVYTVGPNYTNSSSQIVKYNSSGTLQWQQRISFSTAITITRDSSDNLYIGSEYAGYFVKCNSSGTVLYSKSVSFGGQSLYIKSMNCDSSDNVYIHGYIYDTVTSMNKQIVMKYDSSGTVLWQRKIGYAWVGVKGYTNAAGDTYMVGTSNNATSTAGVKSATVVKYNSAGTLQFQRYIKSNVTNATITPTAIKEYGSEKMVITASTDATSAGGYTKQLTIVLPNNGSATGTYTAAGYSWTYATCTDAEAASTITSGVGTATTSTTSHAVPPIWDSLEGDLTVTSTTTTLS